MREGGASVAAMISCAESDMPAVSIGLVVFNTVDRKP